MRKRTHSLPSDVPGTEHSLVSHHFGTGRPGPRIYLQAGLHADELPGPLVLWHLIEHLRRHEAAGQINGEIVVVPCANPIGLAQGLLWRDIGRFELHSGENFNRHYPDLKAAVRERVAGLLGTDAQANTATIRQALRAALAEQAPRTELAALRHALLTLAIDADVVLDLHCDSEAVVHIYTTPAGVELGRALSRHLGAGVVLLASDSGGHCFDESCSTPWDALRAQLGERFPIPAGCLSATVELRGQVDVSDALAAADADHLVAWLVEHGAVAGAPVSSGFETAECVPLDGTQDVKAPFAGLISFHAAVGARLTPGDAVATIIDPVSGERVTTCSENAGIVYARENRRFVRRGTTIAKVSGAVARHRDSLLGA